MSSQYINNNNSTKIKNGNVTASRMVTRSYLKSIESENSNNNNSSLLLDEEMANATLRRTRHYNKNNNNNNNSKKGEEDPFAVFKYLDKEYISKNKTTKTNQYKNDSKQQPIRLHNVPDRMPEKNNSNNNVDHNKNINNTFPLYEDEYSFNELLSLLQSVEQKVIDAGYTLLYFGPLPPPHLSSNHNHNNHNICYQASLTEALRDGCVQCCAPSIADATLSEQYPSYCLEEVCAGRHPYLQGVLVRPSSSSEEVCAFVVSDGKDIYGNIRQTITQYKAAKTRGVLGPVEDTPAAQRFRQDLLSVQDVSDFVHVTLTATHPSYQRRNLAKCLLCLDLSRWALRGRQRSFLNMAIEKRIVYHNNNNEDSGSDTPQVVYAPSLASRRLYHYFHYRDVYPKYNPQTREETWSPKEADCGRVMAVFNFVPRVVEIAEEIINEVIKIGAGESASNSRGRKRSSSPVISTLHAKRKKKI